MIIKLDEHGTPIKDVDLIGVAQLHIQNQMDMHVGNIDAIHAVRLILKYMPEKSRPFVRWFFYGREVFYDKDLQSTEMCLDPRANLSCDILFSSIWGNPDDIIRLQVTSSGRSSTDEG